MSMEIAVALILSLATLLGWVRLGLWHRAAMTSGQASIGRTGALALLQPLCAGLLYLALFPPMAGGDVVSLRIATAGTSRMIGAQAGAPLILLPEAPAIGGGEAVPDLATALRRHPGVTQIHVLGNGLEPRDLDAVKGLAVRFDPPSMQAGIVDIAPPAAVAPGARFIMGGTLNGWPDTTIELLDPAGRVTDSGAPDKDGHFQLAGHLHLAGAIGPSDRRTGGRAGLDCRKRPPSLADPGRRAGAGGQISAPLGERCRI
jgi:hypothetical protein